MIATQEFVVPRSMPMIFAMGRFSFSDPVLGCLLRM
jgi:hypothetical protein